MAKKINPKIKVDVVLEGIKGKSTMEVCRKFRISQGEFNQWRQQFMANAWKAFAADDFQSPDAEAGEAADEEIVIKKGGKGHAAHHGGSWKVAYADFVTALMAFFLLMWLIASLNTNQKAGMADYFENMRIYKEYGATPFYESSVSSTTPETGKGEKKEGFSEELRQEIKKKVEGKYKAISDQIVIETFEDGFRIQLMDKEGNSMFASGSAVLNDWSRDVLELVAQSVKDLPYRIAVEGHTDSVPFGKGGISNWDLSSQRASAAREALERNGIPKNRFSRIVGYADTDLYVPEDPKDSSNRRIAIILLTKKDESKSKEGEAPPGGPGQRDAGPGGSGLQPEGTLSPRTPAPEEAGQKQE
ncbi:MAG: OmpA family protein [Nitrospinae bacterium]|nr:OmpA family protein [Nitrospinota bacterium]